MQTRNLLLLVMVFIVCTTLQAQNVGIGTTSPEARLHVNGNFLAKHQLGGFAVPTFPGLDFNKTLLQGIFFGESYAPQLRFLTNSSGLFMDVGQDSSGNFIIENTFDSPVFKVEQGGNVGIGTTSPGARLQVDGNFLAKHQLGGFTVPTFPGLDFNKTLLQGVFFGESYAPQLRFVTNSSGLFMDIGQDSSGNFIIENIFDSPVFTVAQGGNVGIGVSDPSAKLHVNGNIRLADDANIFGLDGLWGFNDLRFFGDNEGAEAGADMVITADGNIGMGTSIPDGKLHVDGNFRANGITALGPTAGFVPNSRLNVTADVGEWIAGLFTSDWAGSLPTVRIVNESSGGALEILKGTATKPGGGEWIAVSDMRLKQNVNNYESGLEKIRQIRPVSYHYNGKAGLPTEPRFIGVIAQELQKVAPDMVLPYQATDGNEYLSVDPSAFTYMLINAVKEQDKIIQEQQAKIKDMEAKLDKLNALEARLNALEVQVKK